MRKHNIFKSPHDFLNANIKYLGKKELENNLILGIINNIEEKSKENTSHNYISVSENDNIEAVSISTSPRIIISGDDQSNSAIRLICDYYKETGHSMSGVIGEKNLSKLFADYTELKIFKERGLMVHELVQVNELPLSKGSFEKVNHEDAELITDHRLTFETETLEFSRSVRDELLKDTLNKIGKENLFCWKIKGKIVSIAAIMRNTNNIGIIGLVYTPKEYRGNGYATNIVTKLSELILKRGLSKCGLFTDISNPASNHIYKKIGYEPKSEFADIYFEK